MPQVNINIPDNQMNRVADAVAAIYGYKAVLPDGSNNPQSKREFLKAHIARHLKETVKVHEVNIATESARKAKVELIDNEVIIT